MYVHRSFTEETCCSECSLLPKFVQECYVISMKFVPTRFYMYFSSSYDYQTFRQKFMKHLCAYNFVSPEDSVTIYLVSSESVIPTYVKVCPSGVQACKDVHIRNKIVLGALMTPLKYLQTSW